MSNRIYEMALDHAVTHFSNEGVDVVIDVAKKYVAFLESAPKNPVKVA